MRFLWLTWKLKKILDPNPSEKNDAPRFISDLMLQIREKPFQKLLCVFCSTNISVCFSRPPTVMDDMDMDNSMLSVASLPDFAAAATTASGLAGSGCSDDTSAAEMSLTSEAILDIVRPAAAAVEAFHNLEDEDDNECSSSLRFEGLTLASGMSQGLDCVDQPTLVADNTTTSQRTLAADTHTLVAAAAPEGATYCVVPAPAACGAAVADHAGDDTIADVTDICDEESVMEPTLTTDSDAGVEDIPELPRDMSQQATPAASGGESSVETTPLAGRRKLSPREKRQQDPERFLTFTKKERPDSASVSSGYKSEETAMAAVAAVPVQQRRDSASSSSSSASSRTQQRRLEDADRFRTRTISREDIGNIPGNFDIVVPPSSSNNSSTQQSSATTTSASPRGSIRQRRTEEADRYRTHTVSVGDLPPLSPSRIGAVAADMRISPAAGLRITASEAAFLESEARLVVQTIKERKAEARSRSTSVDLLKEPERRRSTFIISRVMRHISVFWIRTR
jgi:hypothetical protein